jgi:tetratricopeptide (TPR) repeat protein
MVSSRFVGLLLVLVLASSHVFGAELPEQWLEDFNAAKVKAHQEKKPILVVFSTSWCGPCQHMVKNVYPEEKIIQALNKWIPVYVDGDEQKELVKNFGVTAYPTYIFLDSQVREQGRFIGGASDGDGFLERIDNALHLQEKLKAVEEKLAQNENDVDALVTYAKLLQESDRNKAKEIFKKAFKIDRKKCASYDLPTLNYLIREADFEAKISKITTLVENDPNNPALLKKRAETYLGQSFITELSYHPARLMQALEDYQTALKLDPQDKLELADDVAFIEAWQMRGDDRIPALKRFCEKYPHSIRSPFALYSLYYDASEKGNLDEAIAILTQIEKAQLPGRFGEYITKTKINLEEELQKKKTAAPKENQNKTEQL